ncbi:MAG: methyl-accepting chemotaxis protein [Eubacteriales bacterium]
MKEVTAFGSLKIRNSFILIIVMVPLFAVFLTYEANQQSAAMRGALTERGVILAQTGATTTGNMLTMAIKQGKLTEEQIFDTDYRVIPGTSPQKYNTEYDSYTDENLREIEDSFLQDKVIVFAVAVDVNGYLPTHNTMYSKAGGGLNFDRTKRIFADDVGIAAAHNLAPYKFQEYKRDTGEVMWDISTPIYVNDRHWGAFRIGFSIDETNRQIAAVINRMVLSGAILTLALVLLAIFISNRISNRVRLLAEEANRVAAGDLSSSDLFVDVRHDEVGGLARSFANMVIKMRSLVEKTQYSARLIDNYTRDLLQSTENVAETANTVTSKMTQVSVAMKKMEDSMENIAETSKRVSEELSGAEVSSQRFLDNMEESKQAMSVAHNVVKDLEFHVDKVGQFIQVVSILAEQAGLMSYKIVKEAAHYCTAGNEMAALATEVQSNAEDAAKTTRDVSELFQTVRDYARQASKTLEGHQSVILEGIKVARISSNSLNTIVSDLQNIAELTKEVLENSKQMVDGVGGINSDVKIQTDLVKRFADAAETLELLVEELQETLETIKV